MNPGPENVPEPVVLIIADISGYTRYMTANAKTLAHSQTIITELVKAIVREVHLPLEVAKLEGDAVFVFCRKQPGSLSWPETKRLLGERLLNFFRLFGERVSELSQSVTCTCNACTHIEKLRLKVVVHSGEALFHRVFNFVELAGVDVIVVHRLLKNSVNTDQYLLLTETATEDLTFPSSIQWRKGGETYDDIGRINTLIYVPKPSEGARPADADMQPERPATIGAAPFSARFRNSWKLYWMLWFAPLVPRSGARRGPFQHLSSNGSTTGRVVFALLTLLLTPVFLAVGPLFVLRHALKMPGSSHGPDADHEHTADGSCCGKP